MDLSFFRNVKGKLKKGGLTFKKANKEEAPNEIYDLAKQLDEQRLNSDICRLAISKCQVNLTPGQVGNFLSGARSIANQSDLILTEDHIKLIRWIYSEALLICDRSFIRPIRLEMGRFFELHQMFSEAADCFKQSMCIDRCVLNLILARRYQSALDELKNCPSHLMTSKEYTSMFLLQLLLDEDIEELRRSSLQHLACISRNPTNVGLVPINDHLFDLLGLLESLLIIQQGKKVVYEQDDKREKYDKIKFLVANRLCAFLDPAQIQLLDMITSNTSINLGDCGDSDDNDAQEKEPAKKEEQKQEQEQEQEREQEPPREDGTESKD